MWVIAAAGDNIPQILALIIGLVGLAGVIFTALKYNRDDTTAVVNQQNTILNDIKLINDELRSTSVALRQERDECHKQLKGIRGGNPT